MIERIRNRLARHVDKNRISKAIDEAEAHTTGTIHVSLAPHFWGSVRRAAERAFHQLRVAHTLNRDGVLFFVVPSRRELVVLGDAGIHAKVGQEFWDRMAAAMSGKARSDDLTTALIHGIHEAGRELARHFPRNPPQRHSG
jgi:uncharacterized membrane protein